MERATISKKRLSLTLSVAFIVCLFVQVLVLHEYGISLGQSFADAAISNGLLFIYALLTFYEAKFSSTSLKDNTGRIFRVITITALIILKEKWLIHFLIRDESYCQFFNQHIYIRICFTALFALLIVTLTWMWYYFSDLQASQLREEKIEKDLKESELNKLRQQLQPHFLFNSLNSISSLVVAEPKQARTMIQNLSDFLRGTIKKEDQQLVALKEELRLLELYLSIEKIRFSHRLKIEIHAPENCMEAKLPPLMLQPLLENSIKFGLYDLTDEVCIVFHASLESGYLKIEIQNPYDTETAQTRHGEGFGLNAISRRLYLLYGRTDLLQTSGKDGLFSCILLIPQTNTIKLTTTEKKAYD
jgi:two-component system, LytTR family, sensor kinase